MHAVATANEKMTLADSTAAVLLREDETDEESGEGACTLTPVPAPLALRAACPATDDGRAAVRRGRADIRRILRGEDDRLLVIVGPCSIHDPAAALDYAARLARLSDELSDRLCIVMRCYFEKPRTTVGWRGLINDPHLDGSYDMAEGLRRARRLLVAVTDMGLPVAAEVLDTATPAYFSDLLSFACVGARTTESQPHRALASGLPVPVGFKNATSGCVRVAVDAMISARESHSYLSVDGNGRACVVRTPGNPDTVVVLRGGKETGPNHGAESVADAARRLEAAELPARVIVDCSHANSGYDPVRQAEVCAQVGRDRAEGRSPAVAGVMLESFLYTGKQPLAPGRAPEYGVSVTDACLGWDETARLLRELAG
jgi:3-deoxy-7-phosphoheptulonate synthase